MRGRCRKCLKPLDATAHERIRKAELHHHGRRGFGSSPHRIARVEKFRAAQEAKAATRKAKAKMRKQSQQRNRR